MFGSILWSPGLLIDFPGFTPGNYVTVGYARELVFTSGESISAGLIWGSHGMNFGANECGFYLKGGLAYAQLSFNVYQMGDVVSTEKEKYITSFFGGVETRLKYFKLGAIYDLVSGSLIYLSLGNPSLFSGELGFSFINYPGPYGIFESEVKYSQGLLGLPRVVLAYRREVQQNEIGFLAGLQVRALLELHIMLLGGNILLWEDYSETPSFFAPLVFRMGIISPSFQIADLKTDGGIGVGYLNGEISPEFLFRVAFLKGFLKDFVGELNMSLLGEPWVRFSLSMAEGGL